MEDSSKRAVSQADDCATQGQINYACRLPSAKPDATDLKNFIPTANQTRYAFISGIHCKFGVLVAITQTVCVCYDRPDIRKAMTTKSVITCNVALLLARQVLCLVQRKIRVAVNFELTTKKVWV